MLGLFKIKSSMEQNNYLEPPERVVGLTNLPVEEPFGFCCIVEDVLWRKPLRLGDVPDLVVLGRAGVERPPEE